MPANPAVSSISAFFPCYNDGKTIESMVRSVLMALEKCVDDFEIIVVDDGSADESPRCSPRSPTSWRIRVVTHDVNRGYGGALISGFGAATKEWVFYTDGDAQYDATELTDLVDAATDSIDLVQGVKIGRGDPLHRRVIGRVYHHGVKFAFRLKVHDTDCDFRLIRRSAVPRAAQHERRDLRRADEADAGAGSTLRRSAGAPLRAPPRPQPVLPDPAADARCQGARGALVAPHRPPEARLTRPEVCQSRQAISDRSSSLR